MSNKLSVKSNITAQVSIQMTLTKGEAKALDALAGYGIDEFLKTFYEKMGRHYLEPFEKDLRTLFVSIRSELPIQMHKIDEINQFIKDHS